MWMCFYIACSDSHNLISGKTRTLTYYLEAGMTLYLYSHNESDFTFGIYYSENEVELFFSVFTMVLLLKCETFLTTWTLVRKKQCRTKMEGEEEGFSLNKVSTVRIRCIDAAHRIAWPQWTDAQFPVYCIYIVELFIHSKLVSIT